MKPNGNGIIEMVDDRSSDRGFFCMDLVGHITDDPQFDGFARRASGQRYFSMPRNFGEVISLYLPPRTALVLTREF